MKRYRRVMWVRRSFEEKVRALVQGRYGRPGKGRRLSSSKHVWDDVELLLYWDSLGLQSAGMLGSGRAVLLRSVRQVVGKETNRCVRDTLPAKASDQSFWCWG